MRHFKIGLTFQLYTSFIPMESHRIADRRLRIEPYLGAIWQDQAVLSLTGCGQDCILSRRRVCNVSTISISDPLFVDDYTCFILMEYDRFTTFKQQRRTVCPRINILHLFRNLYLPHRAVVEIKESQGRDEQDRCSNRYADYQSFNLTLSI